MHKHMERLSEREWVWYDIKLYYKYISPPQYVEKTEKHIQKTTKSSVPEYLLPYESLSRTVESDMTKTFNGEHKRSKTETSYFLASGKRVN